jgi:2'-5' RNA ligase
MLADNVRTFLAVGIPDEARRKLARVQGSFSLGATHVKWVRPELLHLTVRFLGNVELTRLDNVARAARQSVAGLTPFSLLITGLGAFPTERVPRVIWVGLADDNGLTSLKTLYTRAEDALAAQGFAPESRPYTPHLTLGRVREGISEMDRRTIGKELIQVRSTIDVTGEMPIRELVVMKSELGRRGATYSVLASASLGQSPRACDVQ